MIENALKILEKGVCNHCLGRFYYGLLAGYSNEEKGRFLRAVIAMMIDDKSIDYSKLDSSNFYGFNFKINNEFSPNKPEKCFLCNDLFVGLEKYINKAVRKLKEIEYNNFLVGSLVPSDVLEREEKLWEITGIEHVESIKFDLNRELRNKLQEVVKKPINFNNPEVVVLFDFNKKDVEVKINSLYVLGYYKKLKRGFPQSKWGTPGKYRTSIQEMIAKSIVKVTKGKDNAFHGCISHDSTVLLNECILPIGELGKSRENHDVISYNGKALESSKIKDYFCVNAEGIKALEITTKETGRSIKATPEHPFFTSKGMVPLSRLKPGDKVAVYPVTSALHEKISDKVIVDESDIVKIIENHFPMSQKSNLKELAKRGLLPLNLQNKNISILARLVGFMLGDACCYTVRNRDARMEFYEKTENLEEIQKDIRRLRFSTSSIRMRKSKSGVKFLDYDGNEKFIGIGNGSYSLRYESKPLWLLMVALGVPVGEKAVNKFLVPMWIMEAPMNVKREFLAGLMGADGSAPRLDKRKNNRKSFNTPTFSLNKEETLIGNALEYINQLRKLFEEFGVKSSEPRIVPYSTKKNGSKTLKIILEFPNRFENLIGLFGKVNYRYCKERETLGCYATEYLLIKKRTIDRRKDAYKKVLEMKAYGLTPVQIQRKLELKDVSYSNLASWISPKNIKHDFSHIKLPESFPDFDVWLNEVSVNLNDGLVWETIESIKDSDISFITDLTVEPNHNFFANGFLISNCGREDVDARCLDWRPFVIEIIEPKIRNFDLKKAEKKINQSKKIKVKLLKTVDRFIVKRIKSEMGDKTYQVMVKFDKPVEAKELKKLKSLIGTISQRTPERVAHRRADLIRKRLIKELKYKVINKKSILLTVKSSAGLYIKELVHGDNGRTKPSLAELLNVKATPKNLDVIKIERPKNL